MNNMFAMPPHPCDIVNLMYKHFLCFIFETVKSVTMALKIVVLNDIHSGWSSECSEMVQTSK